MRETRPQHPKSLSPRRSSASPDHGEDGQHHSHPRIRQSVFGSLAGERREDHTTVNFVADHSGNRCLAGASVSEQAAHLRPVGRSEPRPDGFDGGILWFESIIVPVMPKPVGLSVAFKTFLMFYFKKVP